MCLQLLHYLFPRIHQRQQSQLASDCDEGDSNERNMADNHQMVDGQSESDQEAEIAARCIDAGSSEQSREPRLQPMEPSWEPKHKIFLSHSGVQKAFTEHLCDKLQAVHHYPFLDIRDDSLPKGEKFFSPLMKAVKECRVAVLVLSDEFFTNSKWPMMELNEFVKAQESTNSRLKILPLFLGITREQFDEKERRDRWLTVWKTMQEVDGTIDLDEWEHAVSKIQGNNGIHYAGKTEGEAKFIERVVEAVCKLVRPDLKWDVSHVQSVGELCKPILQKCKEVKPCDPYNVRVVGLYGMGGVGKTTISRAVCNEVYEDFGGKVCHVELGGMSSEEVLKRILRELTEANPTILGNQHEQLVHLLKERMIRQQVFLVVDNVWDHDVEEVKRYLKARYHDGSVVLVTSRSRDVLVHQLHIPESNCMEMPNLEEEGAIDLFLQHTGCSRESIKTSDEWMIVRSCVNRCRFFAGNRVERCYHYHPLALKVLGSQLDAISGEVWRWQECLDKLSADKFNMLKMKVDALQRKGLIDRVNNAGELDIIIHDLYVEFAEAEALAGPLDGRHFIRSLNDSDVPHELLRWPPNGSCWPFLGRVIIHGSSARSLKRANLHHCKNVEVLDLFDCKEVEEVDVTGMENLRLLVCEDCDNLRKWVGLETLSNLVTFVWAGARKSSIFDVTFSSTALGVVKLKNIFRPELVKFPLYLNGCTILQEVSRGYAPYFYSESLGSSAAVDVGKNLPKSVKKIDMSHYPLLPSSAISAMARFTNLQDLNLSRCSEVSNLTGLCELISLKRLNAARTGISEVPGALWKLKHLEFLDLRSCESLTSILNIAHARALQHVIASFCEELREVPEDLRGLEKLEMLDLRGALLMCTLPKDYERLAGYPGSEGTLKVNIEGCYGLIVPLVKKLRGREMSHANCVDECKCGGESMQSWVEARKKIDGAAYDWLKDVLLDVDSRYLTLRQWTGRWTYLLNEGDEVVDFLIRGLCEHDVLGGRTTTRLANMVTEVTLFFDPCGPEFPQWWVVVATAPCTFRVATERAMMGPWRKTLIHYAIVSILPQFLYWRQRMIDMRMVDSGGHDESEEDSEIEVGEGDEDRLEHEGENKGDDESDWFTDTWLYKGIEVVLQKCYDKLEEASEQSIEPVLSGAGKMVVVAFQREINAAKGKEVKEDSSNLLHFLQLWYMRYSGRASDWSDRCDKVNYKDMFPKYQFDHTLAREILSAD